MVCTSFRCTCVTLLWKGCHFLWYFWTEIPCRIRCFPSWKEPSGKWSIGGEGNVCIYSNETYVRVGFYLEPKYSSDCGDRRIVFFMCKFPLHEWTSFYWMSTSWITWFFCFFLLIPTSFLGLPCISHLPAVACQNIWSKLVLVTSETKSPWILLFLP